MKQKAVSGLILTLLFTSMLALAFSIQPVKAIGTLYIRSDGSVDPVTAPIERDGDLYTLTDNIMSDADGIVIERNDVTLDGAGYTVSGTGSGYGFFLYGVANVTIRNVRILQFYTGIYLLYSTKNTIAESIVSSNSQGINVYQSTNCSLSKNVVTSNQGGIVVYQGSDCTTVENNNVDSNMIGLDIGMANWCTISRNNLTNNSYGMMASQSSHDTITGNNMTANLNFGLVLGLSDFNSVLENNIANNHRGIALIPQSENNTVSENNITANVDGIWVWFTSNNTMSENNIADNNCGIFFEGPSNNNTLSRNNVTNNFVGIRLDYSTGITLNENKVKANEWYGVSLTSSSNSILCGNEVTDNSLGIWLDSGSSNNTLSGNKMANNHVGMGLQGSDNSIYHNNYVDNAVQVVTYNSMNAWDDGYPSGGNYWSDYTGQDLDGDGIGDSPYVIDENNEDRYPLMSPWSPKPPSPDETINELLETIKTWNLPKGTENSLTSKLEGTLHLLGIGNESGAKHKLMEFISQVEALRDKKLDSEQAGYLISEAQRIIAIIDG